MLAPILAVLAASALAAAEVGGPPAGAPPPAPPASPPPAGSGPEARAPIRSWFLIPAPFWLPETKLGLALAAGRDFRVDGSRRASTALALGAISVEGQGSVDGSVDVWFRRGSLVSARVRGVVYPDRYYGIGPSTSTEDAEPFTREFVEASLSGELAALGGRLRAGPRAAARVEEVYDVVPGGQLATSGVHGLDGFTGVGAGASVTWDTRDSPLATTDGTFAQAYYVVYPAALGRNDGFAKGAVDLRTFVPLGGRRVLGLSGVLETADGEPPFTLLSKLGNARFFRGYREGRYRDRIAWAAQGELRTPVAGRLGATAFLAAGDVAPDLGALAVDRLKVAGGAGARFRLTDGGANARLDVAVGAEGVEVYVLLLEAF